jgi:hypothetical protein
MADEPRRREIVLIQRSEHAHRSKLEAVEKWIQVLSVAAIPVVIAVVGAVYQNSQKQQDVRRDYVQLALSILRDKDVKDPQLREWAINLLNRSAPLPMPEGVAANLKSGNTALPLNEVLAGPRDMKWTIFLAEGMSQDQLERTRALRCPIHGVGPWLPADMKTGPTTPDDADVAGYVMRYCCDVLLDQIKAIQRGSKRSSN